MMGNVLNLQILTALSRLLAHCFGSSSWLPLHHFLLHHASALMSRANLFSTEILKDAFGIQKHTTQPYFYFHSQKTALLFF